MRQKVIAFGLMSLLLTVVFELAFSHFNPVSNPASNEAVEINRVLKTLLYIGLPILAIVLSGLALSLVFFHRKTAESGQTINRTSLPGLEVAWTLIPLFMVIGISVFGSIMLEKIVKSEPNELQVNVTASRYLFQFEYPGTGIKSLELVVPVGQRIHFSLTSTDVVHDFWVKEWGPKEDCIPGMTTDLRITPTEIGNYTILCSQLCGPGHTYMTAPVRVLSQADYDAWVALQLQNATPPPTTSMPGMGP